MELKNTYKYFTPLMLGILMFASNFLNTSLFDFGDNNFAVWFVLLLFCFACGWFIDRTLNWIFGGKVLFATILAATLISVLFVTFFREYFTASEIMTENLILYSLRNITLGAMGFFGMAVGEILHLEKDFVVLKEKVRSYEESLVSVNKESELVLKEANIKAEKIINDASAEAKNIILKKERIEQELKEFIQVEKELIKKYEEL
ncbi:MAG TPA: hypothetical protein VJ954_05855 [Ignavibacteriaceae bacterium]|nr:hypothetical protein [Ignavibacteriaceae bacterium]